MHVHIHAFLFLVEKCEDHNKNIGLGYYSAHISEAVHHRFQQIIDSLGGINAEHHPKYMERLGMAVISYNMNGDGWINMDIEEFLEKRKKTQD